MKNKKEKDLYIVYAAKHNGEIVYIGSGAYGREAHINSGCSHVYEINKLHFSGVLFCVEIVDKFETKQESISKERILISQHRPRYNKMFNAVPIKSNNTEAIKRKWNAYFRTLNPTKGYKYRKSLEAMLNFFGWRNMSQGIDLSAWTIRNFPSEIRLVLETCRRTVLWEDLFKLFVVDNILKLPDKTPIELEAERSAVHA